jgi:hypothetical protein
LTKFQPRAMPVARTMTRFQICSYNVSLLTCDV